MAAERGVRARLGPDAIAAFCQHSWPGNVRELQNTIAGLLVAVPSRGRVTERHVRHVLSTASAEGSALSLTAAREVAERRAVAAALARHAGRRSKAASELGLSRQGLTKALRRLGLTGLDRSAGVA
jgi:transcriptional regulator with PAS, ATPase and Fis domain